jgi:CheY-like chemotaxis protein
MDGYEATTEIRNLELGIKNSEILNSQVLIPNCRIIAVTARSFDEEHDVALSQGCDDFLRKPFRPHEIFALLERHLDVHFLYEDSPVAAIVNKRSESRISRSDLAGLPGELRESLRQAVEEIDLDNVQHTINRIRPQYEELAAMLEELVKNYRFDLLQELFEETI